jgi:hypothetical protein
LSTTDGKFANLYDNIFISKQSAIRVNKVEVYDYPKFLGLTHAKGRDSVSDHAPIFLNASLSGGSAAQSASAMTAQAQPGTGSPMKPAASTSSTHLALAVRGNKKTMVYHRPDCPSYNAIAEKNRVEFDSAAGAEAQHYHLAKNCR